MKKLFSLIFSILLVVLIPLGPASADSFDSEEERNFSNLFSPSIDPELVKKFFSFGIKSSSDLEDVLDRANTVGFFEGLESITETEMLQFLTYENGLKEGTLPIEGKWFCKNAAGAENFLEIQQSQLVEVSLFGGLTTLSRKQSTPDQLIIKGNSDVILDVTQEKETLLLSNASINFSLQCTRLSLSTVKNFVPLASQDGSSLLNFSALIMKSLLGSELVKRDVEGNYIIDALQISIADLLLPREQWVEGEARYLSSLYKNAFAMWGGDLAEVFPDWYKPAFGTKAYSVLLDELRKWLADQKIIVNNLSLYHCPTSSAAGNECSKYGYVILIPRVATLPMAELRNFILAEDFEEYREGLAGMESYRGPGNEYSSLGEFSLNLVANTLGSEARKQYFSDMRLNIASAEMFADFDRRLESSPSDLVFLSVERRSGGVCSLSLSLEKQHLDGLNADRDFATWFQDVSEIEPLGFKDANDLYSKFNEGNCRKWIGSVADIKLVSDAARRDGFEVRINFFKTKQQLLDSFARVNNWESYADYTSADELGVDQEQYAALKGRGLNNRDQLDKLWSSEEVTQYLGVVGGQTQEINIKTLMEFFNDQTLGKKSGESAAAIRLARDEKLRQEELAIAEERKKQLEKKRKLRQERIANGEGEFTHYDDGSCKESEEKICISKDDLIKLCEKVDGYYNPPGYGTIFSGVSLMDYKLRELEDNMGKNAYSEAKTYVSKGGDCVFSFRAKGVTNGDAIDRTYYCRVTSIIGRDGGFGTSSYDSLSCSYR